MADRRQPSGPGWSARTARRPSKWRCPWVATLPSAPSEAIAFHSQPMPLAGGLAWQLTWPDKLPLGFGQNRVVVELRAEQPLSAPIEFSVETVVFTPLRPERQTILKRTLAAAGPLALEFQVAHEGAAAVVVTARQGSAEWRDGRAFFVAPVAETLQRVERMAAEFGVPPPETSVALRQRLPC